MIWILLTVLFLYVAAVIEDETSNQENIHLESQFQTELILSCTVRSLVYLVSIVDPSGQEQGNCYPVHDYGVNPCTSFHPNATMSLNMNRGLAVFNLRGKINQSINGNWSCFHGRNQDIAKVEVIVPDETDLNICDEQIHYQIPSFLWAMSLVLTYSVIHLSTSIFDWKRKRSVCTDQVISRKLDRILCRSKKCHLNSAVKQVVFILMVTPFLFVSYLNEFVRLQNMPAVLLSIITGALLGVVMYLMMLKTVNVDKTFNDLDVDSVSLQKGMQYRPSRSMHGSMPSEVESFHTSTMY